MKWFRLASVLCLVLQVSMAAMAADKLVIDLMVSSGQLRTAWVDLVKQFAAENPDLEVIRTERGQEDYKRDFGENLKTQKTDIAFWFAGERLRQWSRTGLLSPLDAAFVSDVLKPNIVNTSYEATRVDGQVYGFPIKYYQWGFFYRKSLFQRLNVMPPSTWAEFLHACEILKKAGVTPLAVGAKDGWPAAAWFDYLDLRINGIEFHRRLLRGEISFSDKRVHQVFSEWKKLLNNGYFLPDTMGEPWDSVMPYVYRERVGMVLMGGSIAAKLPETLVSDIGFFPFPKMSSRVKLYEEAPLDILVLPANGQNPAGAKRFLKYLATSDALNIFNEQLHTVSPRSGGTASADPFVKSAKSLLDSAEGITLFFDRDADSKLIDPAFQAFKKFLQAPHDIDAAIQTIVTQARP